MLEAIPSLVPKVVTRAETRINAGDSAYAASKPFKDVARAQSGLNEYHKVMAQAAGIPQVAYLYRLTDLDNFPLIVNLFRAALQVSPNPAAFPEKLNQTIATLDEEEQALVQKLKPLIEECLGKITTAVTNKLEVTEPLLNKLVTAAFYQTLRFFNQELTKQELQTQGAVYQPSKHCWAGNYMWVLAHVQKNTTFIILCDFNAKNCLSTNHQYKRHSAFAYEFCTLLKAGYVLHIENGITTKLTSQQRPINMELNDGTEGQGINPTPKEIVTLLQQIEVAKTAVPHGTFTLQVTVAAPSGALTLISDNEIANRRITEHMRLPLATTEPAPQPQKPVPIPAPCAEDDAHSFHLWH